jgi:hypothetical protein
MMTLLCAMMMLQVEQWAQGSLAVAQSRLNGELELRVLALVDDKNKSLKK